MNIPVASVMVIVQSSFYRSDALKALGEENFLSKPRNSFLKNLVQISS